MALESMLQLSSAVVEEFDDTLVGGHSQEGRGLVKRY